MIKAALLSVFALFATVAAAQAQCSGQFQPWQVCANANGTQHGPAATLGSPWLDGAFGSAQGLLLNRGASAWTATSAPVLGLTGVARGTLGLSGLTTGVVTIQPQDSTGTWTFKLPASGGGLGQVLTTDGTGAANWVSVSGTGTVTSVGLAAPAEFTVTGSPVTGSSTITLSKATESANTIWSGPTTGAAAAPTFRLMVLGDLPSITANTVIGNATASGAVPTALAIPSCSTATSALTWTTSTGFGCNSIPGTGTVTSVATGTGLTGGPITVSGTLSLATISADNLLGNATAGTAAPAAVPLLSCSAGQNALTYNTATHAFGCNLISGSGTVTTGVSGQLGYYGASTNVINGNANATILNGALTLGTASTTLGQLILEGNTSGSVTIAPQAVAGTPVWTAGTASGTPAVTASAPLAIASATGNLTITGVAGQVLAGAGPAFTATPTLGAGSVGTGQVKFAGTTSGLVTLSVADVAGTWTMKLPSSAGINGQFLETDGSGNATWANVSGSGTVNSATSGQVTYYATSSNAVSGNSNANISAGALTLGQANSTAGIVTLEGATSGALTIATQPVAGTPTWTAGTASGTPVVTASSPLSITAATGNITCPTCTTSGVTSIAGNTGAFTLGQGLTNSTNVLVTASGVDANILNAQTTTYAAVGSDCGKTITLGGTAEYALTVSAASGFPANCSFNVVNIDTGRGKVMTINGITFPNLGILWPSQSFTLKSVNSVWTVLNLPQSWKITGSVTFTIDTAFGVDGNNDCLGTLGTTGACATLANAITQFCQIALVDGAAVTFQTKTGQTHPHQALCSYQNSALVAQNFIPTILGDPTTCTTASNFVIDGGSNSAVQITGVASPWEVKGMQIQATGGGQFGLFAEQKSLLYVGGNTVFGAVTSGVQTVADNSLVQFLGGYCITGGATNDFFATNLGEIRVPSGVTVSLTGTPAFSGSFASATRQGLIVVQGVTYIGTATGAKCVINEAGGITTASANASYLPGSAPTCSGSQIVTPGWYD